MMFGKKKVKKKWYQGRGNRIMDRLCTECGVNINDLNSLNLNLSFTKADYSGDLCKECWNNEWEKCKL